MYAVPVAPFALASATRTASPVPRGGSWTATPPSSSSSAPADTLSFETTTSGRAPAARTVSRTCARSGRPASGCRTFGIFDFIRVESSAASTIASGASFPLRARQAGAPGFEPGIADPKSAALPLGHAPQDTAQGYGCGLPEGWRQPAFKSGPAIARVLLGGLFAPLDQFRDPTTAFAAELRVALATQLRLARL